MRRLTAVAVLPLLVLTACSEEDPTTARTDLSAGAGSTPASPTAGSSSPERPSPTRSDEPDDATSSDAPPVLGRRSGDLGQRLLTAAELPALAPRGRWQGAGVSDAEQEDFSLCHPFSITAIGADQVRVRRYVDARPSDGGTASEPARAGHLLAAFPDARTTRRATAVLESWHDQCEQRLARRMHRVRVGDRVPVEDLPGPASWYRTRIRTESGSSPVVEVTGTVRVGSRVGVVVLRHRKDSYPTVGARKIEAALQRAAAALS